MHLIDVNCLAVTRAIALQLAPIWIQVGYGNDRFITQTLLASKVRGICTGKRTLCYHISEITYDVNLNTFIKGGVLDQATVDSLTEDEVLDIAHQGFANVHKFIKDGQPKNTPLSWEIPTIMENGQLTIINE